MLSHNTFWWFQARLLFFATVNIYIEYTYETVDSIVNTRCILYDVIIFTGGWKRSWFFFVAFVLRFPWVGDFSGPPWHCLWRCVWLSVFLHSSVATTTDVRTRKQRRTLCDVWTECSRTTKEPQYRITEVSDSLPYHHTRTHLNPRPWLSRAKDVLGGFMDNVAFIIVDSIKL